MLICALRRSFLGSILEISTNKFGNVVLIFLASLAFRDDVLDGVLEELELLRADLLEDLGHHVLELLGLRVAGHDQKVLANGELDYTNEGG